MSHTGVILHLSDDLSPSTIRKMDEPIKLTFTFREIRNCIDGETLELSEIVFLNENMKVNNFFSKL